MKYEIGKDAERVDDDAWHLGWQQGQEGDVQGQCEAYFADMFPEQRHVNAFYEGFERGKDCARNKDGR